MQNLINCPKRQYAISKNIFSFLLRYSSQELPIHNLKHLILSRNLGTNTTLISISYCISKRILSKPHNLQHVLSRNRFVDPLCLSKYGSIRMFSSSNMQNNKEDDKDGKDDKDKSSKDPEKNDPIQILKQVLFYLFVLLLYVIATKIPAEEPQSAEIISWQEFVHQILAKGEVKEIVVNVAAGYVEVRTHTGAIIRDKVSNKRYYIQIPSIEVFEEKLREAEKSLGIKPGEGIQVWYSRQAEYIATIAQYLPLLLIFFLLFNLRKLGSKSGLNPLNFLSNIRNAKFTLINPSGGKGVRFKDVAGLREAKIEVMEFVDYLKHPERYKTLGAKVPKGALLLGPPGCGKTLLAKAVATEANVPFLSMNGSEFIEVVGGVGAARVRNLFTSAKKRAPCIIYIDEIDAIGKKRAGAEIAQSSESERTLVQLLVEMDGMTTTENVVILASTNRADVLDKALLRPGRFDRHILIDLPTMQERQQIFETHLEKIILLNKPSRYSELLANLTPGFSGADIANVCNEAALHAARENKKFVDGKDLLYAIDRRDGMHKKTSPLTSSDRSILAYRESGRALVSWLLEHTEVVFKVSIVPRTNQNLSAVQYVREDKKLRTKEQLFEKICVLLGARVAEYMIFNKISSAGKSDLEKVTKIAYDQVQLFGMSPTVGLLSFDEDSVRTKNRRLYSKKLAHLMDIEARKIIAEAYKKTEQTLSQNKDKLKLLADALFEKESLTVNDVRKLIGDPPYKKNINVVPEDFDESSSKQTQPSL